MRSRYTAFSKQLTDYLLGSWHPQTRPPALELDPTQRWIGLRILTTSGGGAEDDAGVVEFEAEFLAAGQPGSLHEVSAFERVDGRWTYRSGRHG